MVLHWNTEHINSEKKVVSSFIVLLYMKITTNILFLHFWTSVKIDMKFSRPRQHTGGVCAGSTQGVCVRVRFEASPAARTWTEVKRNMSWTLRLWSRALPAKREVFGVSRERERKGQSHRQFHTVMCFKAVPSAGVRTTSSFHITRNPEASR